MKTAIVIDSSAYIPDELVKQYHLVVINQPILFGNHLYREGVDLTSTEFYERLRNDKTVPTASQVAMSEMQSVFTKLASEGYQAAICFGISGGLSGFISNLAAFAPSVKDLDVYTVDSKLAGAAEGNLALLAAKLVSQDYSIHDILSKVTELQKATHFLLIVYNMRALSNTGRIMSRSPFIGAILSTRTILTFNEAGRLELVTNAHRMNRAFKKAKVRLDSDMQNQTDNVRISVLDADNSELNKQWCDELSSAYPHAKIEAGKIGPFLGVHAGYKSMGLVWAPDWKTMVTDD
ncbi:DegV family protein [Pediococcus damnosus]|uniref:DegV family protein n=1 Tax=Pediococcus damnosus TaxID=51663 RepID=A0A0R2HIG0_9LACO|nr:DegV family protein [Pediococcus damnosus]AMV60920.1 DegV family protein [Pediococcus damnosus]AMV63485.1 DegV family protein [Pediococcus damnosus]AMV65280.1 DegV family protein [Pediococcus damnosus]AMV66580.1 DegV family protein [Pediococcus damnosus]AMV68869.1 DegV family protein [Pediococcus damnosus]